MSRLLRVPSAVLLMPSPVQRSTLVRKSEQRCTPVLGPVAATLHHKCHDFTNQLWSLGTDCVAVLTLPPWKLSHGGRVRRMVHSLHTVVAMYVEQVCLDHRIASHCQSNFDYKGLAYAEWDPEHVQRRNPCTCTLDIRARAN